MTITLRNRWYRRDTGGMTTVGGAAATNRARDGALALAGGVGLVLAVALRATIAGPYGIGSPRATLVFAAALVALSAGVGLRITRVTPRAVGAGLGGALLLCGSALGHAVASGTWSVPTGHGYAAFAGLSLCVGTAEELLLRGALFDRVARYGPATAVLSMAAAFAALHVPMYGWHVVPLDFAAGVLLGGLRVATGSVWAPVTCHVVADLATWWLR